MSGDFVDRFIEVLNTTFSACDENGKGFVETNKLIDFLISQEPSWVDNELIREEFNKVLKGDLNNVISKEDFIKSLQKWFEASLSQQKDAEKEEHFNSESGKCSSSTSGIEELSEITSANSSDSMEEVYSGTHIGFVSDEQTYTNDDSVDETSLNNSGSSQADPRLVKVLQSEISTLLRKNEYLEKLNDSLLGQVSCLEDNLAKNKNEAEDYKRQLSNASKHLELQIQKQEETEDRINLVKEENKYMLTQLSQAERENTKLKTEISRLEEKLEKSLSENSEKIAIFEELTSKLNKINDLYNDSVNQLTEERENFGFKETERENALKELLTENRNLQTQLDSNTSYTVNIKYKLKAALKELSNVQSTRMTNADNSRSFLTADNSMVFFNADFSLDETIPFETSLLAELKDEVKSSDKECCCVCKQNVTLNTETSNKVDAAVGTNSIDTVDKATMTLCYKLTKSDSCSNADLETSGVESSFKSTPQAPHLECEKSSLFSFIKSRRSVAKWMILIGVIFILSLILLFLVFHIFLTPSSRRSHMSLFYLTHFFNVQVKTLDIFIPIK